MLIDKSPTLSISYHLQEMINRNLKQQVVAAKHSGSDTIFNEFYQSYLFCFLYFPETDGLLKSTALTVT
jgi:hypothetical protein